MKSLYKNIVSLVLLTLVLSACSGGNGGSGSNKGQSLTPVVVEPTPPATEEVVVPTPSTEPEVLPVPPVEEGPEFDANGQYRAIITAVNPLVTGIVRGTLTLVREKDEFIADVRMFNSQANTVHKQSVHAGNACPSSEHDINKDGIIDAREAFEVYGKVLLPLDGDINSQLSVPEYPLSLADGSYIYTQFGSYTQFITDLRANDGTEHFELMKLEEDEALALSGKVVVVYGVAETTVLPPSVGTRGRYASHQTLPIACGVIQKLTKKPGVPYVNPAIPMPTINNGQTVGGSDGNDGSTPGGIPVGTDSGLPSTETTPLPTPTEVPSTPEVVPEVTPEVIPEVVPEVAPEVVPEATPVAPMPVVETPVE